MVKSTKKRPSLRLLRVNENLRHELSAILMQDELHDTIIDDASITVTEVRCSPDLKNADVFVMPLGGRNMDKVLEALQKQAPYLSGVLGRRVQMKYSPKLNFQTDTSFDESEKIEKLLAHPKVARDLDK